VGHRVEAFEIRAREGAEIFVDFGKIFGSITKIAAGEQVTIETDYLMARGEEHRGGDAADVALMSGQQ
jgi:hypothetical protein